MLIVTADEGDGCIPVLFVGREVVRVDVVVIRRNVRDLTRGRTGRSLTIHPEDLILTDPREGVVLDQMLLEELQAHVTGVRTRVVHGCVADLSHSSRLEVAHRTITGLGDDVLAYSDQVRNLLR